MTHLEVITHTTPKPISRSRSCLNNIAVTISVTSAVSPTPTTFIATHLEFIKAQHPALRRQTPRDLRQSVFLLHAQIGVLHSDFVLPAEHVEHERMEVDPYRPVLVRREWRGKRRMEEIHEHGLARPDGAVEVKSLGDVVEGDSGLWAGWHAVEELAELHDQRGARGTDARKKEPQWTVQEGAVRDHTSSGRSTGAAGGG